MKTSMVESVARAVAETVSGASAGTFMRRRDFGGSDRAVETALSRLTAEDELVRVRRGLYYRGKKTRFGMTRPAVLDIALTVAGTGAGPAGVAAARMLGLTTQVPSMVEVAVPGKSPEPLEGVRFRSRSYGRREHKMSPLEIAFIELLRDPGASEEPWRIVARRLSALVAEQKVRPDVIAEEIFEEKHLGARERWSALAVLA